MGFRLSASAGVCGVLALCLALFGCGSESDRAPPAAAFGGGKKPLPGGGLDDAGADPDEDAGVVPPMTVDAGEDTAEDVVLQEECKNFDETQVGGDVAINEVTVPDDLLVTRIESTWEGGCSKPTVRVTLSDGRCPLGNGHELVFFFEADRVETGAFVGITIGQNLIRPESGDRGLRVRYRRPDPLEPAGEWGTCAGAEGFVNFADVPSTRRNTRLDASFQLELTPCDESTEGPQSVYGTINATLRRGLTDVCPSR